MQNNLTPKQTEFLAEMNKAIALTNKNNPEYFVLLKLKTLYLETL